jgi:hypothetical protein
MGNEFSLKDWMLNPFPITSRNLFLNMPLWMFVEFATVLEDGDTDTGFKPFKLWPKQKELTNKIDINSDEFEKCVIIAKRRQTGGSETMAALIVKIMVTEPRAQIVVISRNEAEAQYFLDSRVRPKLANLPRPTDKNGNPLIIYPEILSNDRLYIETELGRDGEIKGSNVTALASHPDAGSGRTVRLVVMDEAEKIEHAGRIFTSVRPIVERNRKGQFIILSSGQLNGTWFKRTIRRVYDREMLGVNLFFISRWDDPTATKEWWDEIKTQFPTEVDAVAAYPECIEDLFLTPEGKVFPQFEEKVGGRHVRSFEINHNSECKWTYKFITAMDPGQVHPAAFLMTMYDQYSDMLYVFDEIVVTNTTISDLGEMIKTKLASLPTKPVRNLCDTQLFRKTGMAMTEGQVLSKVTGLNFVGAKKADSEGSRQLLSMRLSSNRIVIHPRCVKTILQLRDWVFDSRGIPVDIGDDCIDDLRYICAEVKSSSKAEDRPAAQPYSTESTNKIRSIERSRRSALFGTLKEKHWTSY